ncbi:MAG: hypothetical protein IJV51_01365 [Oscillospiraceae bacterium]|nr:hypothetical protein [Oscillospiraceae bacterium]
MTARKPVARRVLAMTLALMLVFALAAPGAFAVLPTRGDLLRYIPVAVSIDENAVSVYGYFTNLNPDCSVSNFRNFEMAVFMDEYLIASGSFTAIENFEIEPEGVLYHTFIFPGKSGLYPGTYICDDDDYAMISCTFDYSEMVFRGGGTK